MTDAPKWAIQGALSALALIALIVALNLTGWRFDPFNRAKADRDGRVAAEAQSDLNAGATRTVEHVLRTETLVRTQAEEANRNVQSAEDAAGVLDAHVAGIGGMREATAVGSDPRSRRD